MEFLLGTALLVIIMLCLGFGLADILWLFLGLVAVLVILIGVFFVVCLAVLPFSEKKRGAFAELDEEGRYPHAVYEMADGERVKNIFPCEMVMRERLYIPGKEITLLRIRKRRAVIDKNALFTILVGGAVFIPFAVIAVIFFVKWFGSIG